MVTDTEGLVLRQIKAANGRRMIVILTKRYGKISAGTSISEGGKNKTALALRPFTYGRYELFKARDSFSINGAETLQSFYAIGEDVDKYMTASYALELTDAMAQEDEPQPALLALIRDFLQLLDERKSAFGTLLVGFQMKALQIEGSAPQLDRCMRTGNRDDLQVLSVADGGMLCGSCADEAPADPLRFALTPEQLSALRYMAARPITALKGIGLNEETEKKLRRLFKAYFAYHLGIENLKSESLLI
ncbi:MAG: DNA repair protein RecO [Firmicutes bacterium]|nr:DNA repair protein RecO [Bacillota bacterium]